MYISNLVRMTRFQNSLHQVRPKSEVQRDKFAIHLYTIRRCLKLALLRYTTSRNPIAILYYTLTTLFIIGSLHILRIRNGCFWHHNYQKWLNTKSDLRLPSQSWILLEPFSVQQMKYKNEKKYKGNLLL
jgi:hypothetical protein